MGQNFEFHDSSSNSSDGRAFVRAASLYARADEQSVHLRSPAWISRRALRTEALAITSLEGLAVRTEALCRLLGSRDTSRLDRGTKLAADIFDALAQVCQHSPSAPSSEEIRGIFDISDRSSGRVMRPDLVWSIEEDAAWMSDRLSLAAEAADPWTSVEIIREIWTSGRFHSTARRMAMLFAPWIVAVGFGGALPLTGIAARVVRDVDRFRDAATSGERWALEFAMATGDAAQERHRLSTALLGERATLLSLCPAERTSSSVGAAVEYMIGNPVFTVKAFCDALGLTPRGAKVVLDKLEEARVVEVEGGSRNRNYVCRRCL